MIATLKQDSKRYEVESAQKRRQYGQPGRYGQEVHVTRSPNASPGISFASSATFDDRQRQGRPDVLQSGYAGYGIDTNMDDYDDDRVAKRGYRDQDLSVDPPYFPKSDYTGYKIGSGIDDHNDNLGGAVRRYRNQESRMDPRIHPRMDIRQDPGQDLRQKLIQTSRNPNPNPIFEKTGPQDENRLEMHRTRRDSPQGPPRPGLLRRQSSLDKFSRTSDSYTNTSPPHVYKVESIIEREKYREQDADRLARREAQRRRDRLAEQEARQEARRRRKTETEDEVSSLAAGRELERRR
jgi:hypothetical protein